MGFPLREGEVVVGTHQLSVQQASADVSLHAGLIVQLRGKLDRVVSVDRTPFDLGRSPVCDLIFSEASVSPLHARILRDGDRFEIEDLGSGAGTLVQGAAIERSPLEVGDEITLGDYQLTFLLDPRPIAEEIQLTPALADSLRSDAVAHSFPLDALPRTDDLPLGTVISEGDTNRASGVQSFGLPPEELAAPGPANARTQGAEDAEILLGVEERDDGTAPFVVADPIDAEPASGSELLSLELEIDLAGLPAPVQAALRALPAEAWQLALVLKLRSPSS